MLKKLFSGLVAVTCLILAPFAHADIAIEHWQTRTGARVYFVPLSTLPILDVHLGFAAGDMFDPANKSGLASFTHKLLDLGAGDLNEVDISNRLADVGALLGGGKDSDRASVSLRTLTTPEKQAAALEVFEKILHQPHFAANVFAREQARSIAGLKDALTRPDTLASRAFWSALYPEHPYGVVSTPESLAAITVEDVRQFWRTHYTAANAVISIVGDLDRNAAYALAERLAAALPPGEEKLPALPAAPVVSEGKVTRVPHPASQAHVYLGLPAIARGDPDFFPLLVGNYTLGGGGFVSRLMNEIREKRGYAYSVYSGFSPMKQNGPFTISLQTKKEQADEATALTKKLLADFVQAGPTPDELAAAKAYLIGSFPLNLDSNGKILGQVANIGFYGLPLDYLTHYQERIQAVTLADIRAAFTKHVRLENLVEVTVGAAEVSAPEQ
ncbi:peptidase M16 [Betaproteobacteria bacterium]|nr:peptidase M16 [Betaproteobacteria bacterium]GHU44663.1 peptidase M16 [Betaproteobacteria bacterium]